MLHILKYRNVIFCFLFISLSPAFGQDQKFFDNPVQFFGEYKSGEGCKGCKNVTPEITKKGEKGKEEKDMKLLVFVDPESRLSFDAIKAAQRLGKNYPEVEVKGILITKIEGLKERLIRNKVLFDGTFTFDYEPGFETAAKYGVTEVPCFVFIKENKVLKIGGQPDLFEIYRSFKKI